MRKTLFATQKVPGCCRYNLQTILYRRQDGRCPIAETYDQFAIPDCLHHAGMPNTKTNRAKYSYVIHSVYNLAFVCNDPWHLRHGRWGQRKGYLWADRLQKFLAEPRHQRARLYVNGYIPRFFF